MTCPYCKRYFPIKKDTINHINKEHADQLEKDNMNADQALYFSTHGKLTGICMCGCGRETHWNYKTGKPYRVSNNPTCRERLHKQAVTNHTKVYGVPTLLNDMEHQKEMLAHRHTSGKYKFTKDNIELEYASQLELSFLKFCDKIMEFHANMIQDPPEAFQYYDTKTKTNRQYIPDYYLPDYNLMIEIKDAGNTNPAFLEETKYKVPLKDKMMKDQKKYNYIRINGTKYGPFVELLYDIVHNDKNNGSAKKENTFIVITENSCNSIDEQMDCSELGSIGKTIHFMVIYSVDTCMVTATALSDSIYLTRWLLSSYNDNSLKEITINDTFYKNTKCIIYRYAGDREKIINVINILYNLIESNVSEPWDILSILRENDIYFANPDIFNNENKQMDFIKTAQLIFNKE